MADDTLTWSKPAEAPWGGRGLRVLWAVALAVGLAAAAATVMVVGGHTDLSPTGTASSLMLLGDGILAVLITGVWIGLLVGVSRAVLGWCGLGCLAALVILGGLTSAIFTGSVPIKPVDDLAFVVLVADVVALFATAGFLIAALIRADRRFLNRIGHAIVALAIAFAVATVPIFAGYTPTLPTNEVVLKLLVGNLAAILILFGLLVAEAWRLYLSWRAGAAATRLHMRIVGLFSIIAAVPAILIAAVGFVSLDRTLDPPFMREIRGFISNTAREAAQRYQESQCLSLVLETGVTATDLDYVRPLYDQNRSAFQTFLNQRARLLGFTTVAVVNRDGSVTARADQAGEAPLATLLASDYDDARKNEPVCLFLGDHRSIVSLSPLSTFDNSFLYAVRMIDPVAIDFQEQAASATTIFTYYDASRQSLQTMFTRMYVVLATVMLLAATWVGLSFANRLVQPIRRLIAATDQVSLGNLYVQVPTQRQSGDLGRLGETFNKMTSELRLQQNRLITANQVNDERRVFTEAVLSGVPAAVVGVDDRGRVTVLNTSAQKLLEAGERGIPIVGSRFEELVPELAEKFAEARASGLRQLSAQTRIVRNGRERSYNVRITTDPHARVAQTYVVTLDDITDLVQAQRTSAWADVARRIAHEIKNPLTPIQLSAERLKRKYGKVITVDRDIFDQCTDTIVRQVDDIKRMVDEFSSFARMPKARLEEDDLTQCIRQVLFLMRVGHPTIDIVDHLPEAAIIARFDRRLLSQALTNIVKNATEGVEASDRGEPGRIRVDFAIENGVALIDVSDNGIGFPTENRQALLEPYMTTRAEGTGLGLPIVAKILEDHGGGIELLDAKDGPGARVRLFFPVSKSETTADVSPS